MKPTIGPKLYNLASELGLRLGIRAGALVIVPVAKCPVALREALDEYAPEVLAYLVRERLPVVHLARQILDGEFDDADRSTLEALRATLLPFEHDPFCQSALRWVCLWHAGLWRRANGKSPLTLTEAEASQLREQIRGMHRKAGTL